MPLFYPGTNSGGQYSAVEAGAARDILQDQLKRVMVRTERVGATDRRDAMLSEPTVKTEFRAADTRAIGPASCWSVFYGGRMLVPG